ncbi:DnaD domain-containing protein, partial [Romboutsia ilealis]
EGVGKISDGNGKKVGTKNKSTINKSTINKSTNNTTKEVTRYVEQTLGIIGPNNTLELLSFLDDGVEADVIIRAIDLAIGNGKRNYSYVKGILNNWISEGIKKSAQLTEHLNNKKKKFDTYSIADNDKNYNNSGVNNNGKCSTDNDKEFRLDSKIEEEVGTFTDTSGIDWSKY